jgi:hypothetical protein
LGLVVIGSSAKKSVDGALGGATGLGGGTGGSPPICGDKGWTAEGGGRLVVDMLDAGGGGRGSPELDVMLLLRGGGAGTAGAADTAVRGAGRFRVVTMSSGMS